MGERDYVDIADLDRNRLARAQYEREIGAIEARLAGDRNAGASIFQRPEDNPRNNATITNAAGESVQVNVDGLALKEERQRRIEDSLRMTNANIATYENLIANAEREIEFYREFVIELARENEELGAQMRDVPLGPEGDAQVREIGTQLEQNREEIENINSDTIPDLQEQIENYRANIGRERENRVNIEKRRNFYAEQQRKYVDAENQRDRARLVYLRGMIDALEAAEKEMLEPAQPVQAAPQRVLEPTTPFTFDVNGTVIGDNRGNEPTPVEPTTPAPFTFDPEGTVIGDNRGNEPTPVEPTTPAPFTFDPEGTVIGDNRENAPTPVENPVIAPIIIGNKVSYEETMNNLNNMSEIDFESVANDELQQRIFLGVLVENYLNSDYHNFTEEQRVEYASTVSLLGGLTNEHYYQTTKLPAEVIGDLEKSDEELAKEGAMCIGVDLMSGLTNGDNIYPPEATPNLIEWQKANNEKIRALSNDDPSIAVLPEEEEEIEETKKPSLIGLIGFKLFKRPPYKIKEVATNPEYLQEYMEWKEKFLSDLKKGGIIFALGIVTGALPHVINNGNEEVVAPPETQDTEQETTDDLEEDEEKDKDETEMDDKDKGDDTGDVLGPEPAPNPPGEDQPTPPGGNQPEPPANPEPIDPVIPTDPVLPDPPSPEPTPEPTPEPVQENIADLEEGPGGAGESYEDENGNMTNNTGDENLVVEVNSISEEQKNADEQAHENLVDSGLLNDLIAEENAAIAAQQETASVAIESAPVVESVAPVAEAAPIAPEVDAAAEAAIAAAVAEAPVEDAASLTR